MGMARKRKISENELQFDYNNTSSDSEYSETNGKRPVARNAANARERARMRVLSKAFTRLKTSLPWVPADTKLSKLDTLRLAASYINHLRQILAEEQTYPNSSVHPFNLF
ncbi:unnamed protein product [Medioppia subpectinata]|uniref:BHLH domain-containing protein n=1 Tax=Medioppia subpectinata TaxID=1979941 RepID=A0A7R9L859_9ACAR|nr:unnamed protein product [Medioppia subpectinata]CAG2116787.1 unnamed protein product [Medioppia subpectinata]